MGDGLGRGAGDNRVVRIRNFGREQVLEWRPRVIVLVLVLVIVAVVAGYLEIDGPMNWEW
jgi:hypothetical protein